jgi:hypothetical protein
MDSHEDVNVNKLKKRLASLYSYLAPKLGFQTYPKVIFRRDISNSKNIFGKTGYYDPLSDTIVIYITSRHPKDILRTFSHECVHRAQHQNNLFNIKNEHDTSLGYAQKNPNLRKAEGDAYYRGSLLFRDFCDININKK